MYGIIPTSHTSNKNVTEVNPVALEKWHACSLLQSAAKRPTMKAILTTLSFIMLSTFVHSFSAQSRKLAQAMPTRLMMSTPAGANSIVETCRQKIVVALETDNVKVTGAMFLIELLLLCYEFFLSLLSF